jgi:hypothetical protein
MRLEKELEGFSSFWQDSKRSLNSSRRESQQIMKFPYHHRSPKNASLRKVMMMWPQQNDFISSRRRNSYCGVFAMSRNEWSFFSGSELVLIVVHIFVLRKENSHE